MLTTAQLLAQNNFGDTRTGGLAGPMGLFLIVLLATATVLLIRNMNQRLRRLPDRFPAQLSENQVGHSVLDPTEKDSGQDSRTTSQTRAHLPGDPSTGA